MMISELIVIGTKSDRQCRGAGASTVVVLNLYSTIWYWYYLVFGTIWYSTISLCYYVSRSADLLPQTRSRWSFLVNFMLRERLYLLVSRGAAACNFFFVFTIINAILILP